MNSDMIAFKGFGEQENSFRAGMLAIEGKYLDFFMEHGRLQEYFISYFVVATGTLYFQFLDNSSLPDYIRQECTRLFQEIFS